MTLLYIALAILTVAIGACLWFGRDVLREHPIRIIAIVSVAAMAFFLGYMAIWLTNTLSSSDWCAKALQAERISMQNFGGLTACVDLLKIQLNALASNSKIVIGSFSFGMVVLVVIVLAGGRASGTLPGGGGFDISAAADLAAKAAASASASATAAAVSATAAATQPAPAPTVLPEPAQQHNGPGMPEPPKGG